MRTTIEELSLITGGQRVHITASFGVATASGVEAVEPDPAGLIAAADSALYEAKRAGRNRVVLSGAPPGAAAAG